MNLPKTHWEDLSEEAKEKFALFYIDSKHGFSLCEHCPADPTPTYETKCGPFCVTLFSYLHHPGPAGVYCPCKVWGKAEAAEALRKCLVKDGWIEDD